MHLDCGGGAPVAVTVSSESVGAWASWPDDILFVSERGGLPKSQLDTPQSPYGQERIRLSLRVRS